MPPARRASYAASSRPPTGRVRALPYTAQAPDGRSGARTCDDNDKHPCAKEPPTCPSTARSRTRRDAPVCAADAAARPGTHPLADEPYDGRARAARATRRHPGGRPRRGCASRRSVRTPVRAALAGGHRRDFDPRHSRLSRFAGNAQPPPARRVRPAAVAHASRIPQVQGSIPVLIRIFSMQTPYPAVRVQRGSCTEDTPRRVTVWS